MGVGVDGASDYQDLGSPIKRLAIFGFMQKAESQAIVIKYFSFL